MLVIRNTAFLALRSRHTLNIDFFQLLLIQTPWELHKITILFLRKPHQIVISNDLVLTTKLDLLFFFFLFLFDLFILFLLFLLFNDSVSIRYISIDPLITVIKMLLLIAFLLIYRNALTFSKSSDLFLFPAQCHQLILIHTIDPLLRNAIVFIRILFSLQNSIQSHMSTFRFFVTFPEHCITSYHTLLLLCDHLLILMSLQSMGRCMCSELEYLVVFVIRCRILLSHSFHQLYSCLLIIVVCLDQLSVLFLMISILFQLFLIVHVDIDAVTFVISTTCLL